MTRGFLLRVSAAQSSRLRDSLAFAAAILALVFVFVAPLAAFAQNSAAPPNPVANNSAAPSSPLPAAWANWKYSRIIDLPSTLPAGETERLVKLRLPAEIFAHAQPDLADLRVIDDHGAQTPYVLRVASGQRKVAAVPARQLESSFVPGQYTQIILDAGPRAPFYNSLGVPAMLDNFIAWARVEASDDARVWRQLAAPAPIYRFAQKNGVSELTLHFSPTNARYLRLRIYYKPSKFQVAGISLHHTVSLPREDVPVAAIAAANATQQDGETIFHADIGYPLPVDGVRIASSAAEFDRSVQIYSSEDDQHWNFTGFGRIYKFSSPLPPSPEEVAARADEEAAPDVSPDALSDSARDATGHYVRLACNFSSRPARYWRVEIENGDDAPLADASAELSLAARDVFFRQQPGRSYMLVYGQSQLHTAPRYEIRLVFRQDELRAAPQYDLVQTLTDAQMNAAFAAWALGPERANSAWVDPRPWTERHSVVLWLAVVLAALALTALAIQSLKSSPPPPDAPPPAE